MTRFEMPAEGIVVVIFEDTRTDPGRIALSLEKNGFHAEEMATSTKPPETRPPTGADPPAPK